MAAGLAENENRPQASTRLRLNLAHLGDRLSALRELFRRLIIRIGQIHISERALGVIAIIVTIALGLPPLLDHYRSPQSPKSLPATVTSIPEPVIPTASQFAVIAPKPNARVELSVDVQCASRLGDGWKYYVVVTPDLLNAVPWVQPGPLKMSEGVGLCKAKVGRPSDVHKKFRIQCMATRADVPDVNEGLMPVSPGRPIYTLPAVEVERM